MFIITVKSFMVSEQEVQGEEKFERRIISMNMIQKYGRIKNHMKKIYVRLMLWYCITESSSVRDTGSFFFNQVLNVVEVLAAGNNFDLSSAAFKKSSHFCRRRIAR